MLFRIFGFALNLFICVLLSSCGLKETKPKPEPLIIFYAPCFSPVMKTVRSDVKSQLNISLVTEPSGSQIAVRKLTELGRNCDILMLADNRLFKQIASSHCRWRMDFLNDEIVLGVGIRAKKADDAEKNWVQALLDDTVKIKRVDENLGPIGYRTLLVWKLMENKGYTGLADKLKNKADKPVDDVDQLAVLLKSGETDYGFVYKTTCISNDIRYIQLDKDINLSSNDIDYSPAKVQFKKLKTGSEETVTVAGEPVAYGLSIPVNAQNKEGAVKFINYLFNRKDLFESFGFIYFKPKFYGTKEDFEQFKDIADYAGDFL